MFDLDADPRAIASALSADPRLKPLLRKRPGLRLPSGWDGFEIAVRAILGQQVSVAAARTFATRIAGRFGTALPAEHTTHGLAHLFPTPEALADADLSGIGITRTRADTVRTIACALLDGRVDFHVERTLDDFVARWTALPGIGPWTAQYIALRALGHPDAFPADDLVLQKAVPLDGTRMTAKALTARAEAWRPWRGYATLQLWREAMTVPAKATATRAPTSKRAGIAPATSRRTSSRGDDAARRTGTRRTNP
jgi:AraC family transcriptional regulator of adaptative response / DNA-3-methyladenine glycosylase II